MHAMRRKANRMMRSAPGIAGLAGNGWRPFDRPPAAAQGATAAGASAACRDPRAGEERVARRANAAITFAKGLGTKLAIENR